MLIFLSVFIFVIGGVDLQDDYKQCRLEPHPSVEYQCLSESGDSRPCAALEPAGTRVNPTCRTPNYFSPSPLPYMRCFDGYWDYVAKCMPECGRVTPSGNELVAGGTRARRGELPWHAGVYGTGSQPFQQLCGGSLISDSVVISAAHCFWSDLEKQLPASRFAVALGKLYRPWNDAHDQAQKSRVRIIHLPPRFQGAAANFQEDLAVVVLATRITLRAHVRPVCLSFDRRFEQLQLLSGNMGKVAGWGLTGARARPSPVLQTVELPYVEVGICIRHAPLHFREFITSDKICAGTLDDSKALCRGDSGGGLSFAETTQGAARYYLRGVVSAAPAPSDPGATCNTRGYTAFTTIASHERFIREYWVESGEFRCDDGGFVSAVSHCDGELNCADGSDETARACANKPCSDSHFRCKYGACIDRGGLCNNVQDCVDGSDEADCDSASVCRSPNDPSVPAPGYEYEVSTGRCYKFVARKASWGAANGTCASEGALLAAPGPAPAGAPLRALFRRHPASSLPGITYRNYLAVGIYKDGDGWRTIEGGDVDPSLWYPGFPEGKPGGVYAFMERDGKIENYSDDPSAIAAPFVCELKPLPASKPAGDDF